MPNAPCYSPKLQPSSHNPHECLRSSRPHSLAQLLISATGGCRAAPQGTEQKTSQLAVSPQTLRPSEGRQNWMQSLLASALFVVCCPRAFAVWLKATVSLAQGPPAH